MCLEKTVSKPSTVDNSEPFQLTQLLTAFNLSFSIGFLQGIHECERLYVILLTLLQQLSGCLIDRKNC